MLKYDCKAYREITEVQKVVKMFIDKHLKETEPEWKLIMRFQVEHCNKRETEVPHEIGV